MTSFLSTTLALAALTIGSAAAAQDMSMMNDLQRSCMQDAKKYCAKELPKPEQLMQCLVNNQSQLSAPCKASTGRIATSLGLKPQTAPSPN
jgi:hypothetical protein